MSNNLFERMKNLIKAEEESKSDNSSDAKTAKTSHIKSGAAASKTENEKKNSIHASGIKDFIGHVIEPEERTLKNYMDIGFWKRKRELYRELRGKEKQDQNVYQNLFNGARPTIEYYILTVLSCIIATTGLLQWSTAKIDDWTDISTVCSL